MSGQNSQKSQIDRYYIEMEGDICGPVLMERVDANGEWVRYEDHKAEIETLTRKLDTCGLQCSATMKSLDAEIERLKGNLGVVADSHQWLYREKQRLETTLRGISTCSACEACRGAALRALGGEPGTWMPPCPICKKADCRLTYEECHRASQPPGDG